MKQKAKKTKWSWWYIVFGIVLILTIMVGGYWYSFQKRPIPPQESSHYSFAGTGNLLPSYKGNQPDSVSFVWKDHVRQDTIVGTLSSIDRSGGITDGFTYQVRLSIAVGEKGDQSVYYFSSSELKQITVFRVKNGIRESSAFNQLHQGDRIIATQKIDLRKPLDTNLLEFTITRF